MNRTLLAAVPGVIMLLTGSYLAARAEPGAANQAPSIVTWADDTALPVENDPPSTITVVATATTWAFTPSSIKVRLKKPTTLHLTSKAGVHSVASDDLGIKSTTIRPGTFTDVTFTPSRAGRFVLHCGTYCGAGHPSMALTVIVASK